MRVSGLRKPIDCFSVSYVMVFMAGSDVLTVLSGVCFGDADC